MKYLLIITALLLQTTATQAQTPSTTKPLTIGTVTTIRSELLQEERTLNIYLPEQFNKDKAYPVIYLLDGAIDEDFLHVTGLVQFFRLQFKMPDCIIVGIANTDRKRDFTFHTDLPDLRKDYPTTGHSDRFIRFLETELLPFIQASYKTTGTRYIIGQSLGGLLASEILLKKPQLFTHYLIVSPSLWWDNESLLQQAKSLLERQENLQAYVYISAGMNEDKIMQREAAALANTLTQAKKKGLTVNYQPMAGENHATILHQSLYKAFEKLFPFKE